MEQETPLAIFRRWQLSLSDELLGHQMIFLRVHLGATDKALSRWLDVDPPGAPRQVGTVVRVAGLIDFVMETMGTADYWERLTHGSFNMVETSTGEARELSNGLIGSFLEQRDAWLAAAQGWREPLTYRQILEIALRIKRER
jgi:hypothetical protein